MQARPTELGYQMLGLHGVSISGFKNTKWFWLRQKVPTQIKSHWILLMCMLGSPTLFLSQLTKMLQTITWWQALKCSMQVMWQDLALVCCTMISPPHLLMGLFRMGLTHLIKNSPSIRPDPLGSNKHDPLILSWMLLSCYYIIYSSFCNWTYLPCEDGTWPQGLQGLIRKEPSMFIMSHSHRPSYSKHLQQRLMAYPSLLSTMYLT